MPTIQCGECGRPFHTTDLERDVCHVCEARSVREQAPELIHDDDRCKECDTPIGQGSCAGCCAAAVSGDMDEPPDPESVCPHCGKDRYDFSDMGCEYCDARHPGFGVL
jgi:hypothetical protein